MEYIDPQLFSMSALTESGDILGPSTADKGTQTQYFYCCAHSFVEPEPYSDYPPLDASYPPLAGWSSAPQMANYSPYSGFAYPYPEPPAMLVEPQYQYGCFPEPHLGPMTGMPGVPNFNPPEYPMSFQPPEPPIQDCIVVNIQEEEVDSPAKESRPNNRRRSTRRNSIRSSEPPRSSASRRQQPKRKVMPLQPGEQLSKPLSKLALEMPHVPKFDMDAFLRRGANKRVQQKGVGEEIKISRPVNPFILYRRAYYLHAKALCKSGCTAQTLSRMIGASYRSEDKTVKDQFARYAEIEKEQHYRYFPNYKFSPKRHTEEY
ncbi:hypothetical protein F5B17DRAFT_452400 [Nemania serpens]|nr:hypothetical protein F5B17DRAFT_452400 [Nemania serpens]